MKELSYQEKLEYLKLLEEREARNMTGGHLCKIWPDDGPLSWKEYPKHMNFIRAGQFYRERFFCAGNRCLAEGTLVATPAGPVPIEDLKVGDYVYDRYGVPTRVVETWDNGEAETVSLQNRGKEYVRCTPEHGIDALYNRSEGSIFTKTEGTFERKVKAGKLTPRNSVRRRFPKAPLGRRNEPHSYALGALLGDGCCRQDRRSSLCISSIDDKIPAKVASCLKGTYKKASGNNYSWHIKARKPRHYKKWMAGKYSHEKVVDLAVIRKWNRKSILEFVAGLIDTDGSLTKSRDVLTLGFHNQSKSAIEAFSWCVSALWLEPTTISVANRDKYVNGPVYTAMLRNPHAIKRICEELEPHLVHKYKADTSTAEDFGKRSQPLYIYLSPKPGKLERVYDITIEHPEHFFLLANGVSVSNTGKSLTGAYEVSAHATGLYPGWWMGRKYDRPVEVWCAGDIAKTTRDILQRELIGPPGDIGTGMIAKDRISNLRMKAGVPDAVDSFKVKHESGGWSRIGFLSYDQKRRAFQGTSKDIILLDEEPPNDVYSECVMRTMTTDGMVLVTATPLLGLSEFIQEFMDNADHGDLPDIKVEL